MGWDIMIGKVQRVGLREVWRHEALDFTTWLEQNIDVLNDALDLTLINVDREKSAGDFSVDLVAEDDAGGVVVIENQLERSDHSHLGKLITYLTALEARAAIWIVSEPRAEHVRAVAWLNESSAVGFYLVKVEAIRIGESLPAPLLTLITGPSEEAVRAGDAKKELAERYQTRLRFWTRLLDRARQKTRLHAAISPSQHNAVGTASGLPHGLNLNYVVRQHDAQVELHIDAGRESEEANKAIFEQLLQNREQIEERFGEALEWDSVEGRQRCKVLKVVPIAGWENEDLWSEAHDALVDAMIRLERALRPHFKELKSP